MSLSEKLALQVEQVYFGGNWSVSSVFEQIEPLSFLQSQGRLPKSHSIFELFYHLHYFVNAQLDVLQNKPLTAKDSESFNVPLISSDEAWNAYKQEVWKDARAYIQSIQSKPDGFWNEHFVDVKYGIWYRNVSGCIEHIHYHLGQIALIRKQMSN